MTFFETIRVVEVEVHAERELVGVAIVAEADPQADG